MSLRGWFQKDIEGLRGAWTRSDQRRGQPRRASEARNMRYPPEGPTARCGLSTLFAVAGKVSSMYHWITTDPGVGKLNRVVFFEGGTKLRMKDLIYGNTTDLYTLSGRAAVVQEAGSRLYAATFNTSIVAAGQTRVVHPLIGGSPSDKAFAPPMAEECAISEPTTGECSEGTHRFGYIMESRSGFLGRPGPRPSDVFTPTEFEISSGGITARMTFTTDIPDDAAYVHPIMTRVGNPDRWYFVPDGAMAVPGGAVGWLVTLDISISDSDLGTTAVEADDHFDYLAQVVAGTGPFSPSAVVAVGRRLAYFVANKIYISDIDDFEVVTEDQHVIQLPGRKEVVTGFQLRGVFYILGPKWTYAVADNTDYPRTWAVPDAVSEALGTSAPFGVQKRTTGDFVWVANVNGLYIFDGKYSEKPISYMNKPEWDRINWAAPYSVHVVDDVVNQTVMVAAALDTATEPSHILTWDYSRGLNPFTVDFSLDDFDNGEFSSLAAIQDASSGKTLIVVGPDAAGNVLQFDTDESDDDGDKINSLYETGQLLTRSDRGSRINRFGGFDVDVKGEGLLHPTIYNKGRTARADPPPINLENPSDDNPQSLCDLTSENATIKVETNAVDHWFNLGMLRVYWRRWIT